MAEYTLKISNEHYEDLIYPDNLVNFTISEEAFGNLPVFTAIFQDNDKDKIRTLTEITPLNFTYTKGENEFTSSWVIKKCNIHQSIDSFGCTMGGYLKYFSYCKNNITKYVTGTSKDAMEQIVKPYFTFINRAPEPKDKMNWLSFGKPDKRFMNEVWTHSYIPNDLTLIGITSSGNFIRTSLLTEIKKGAKFTFSNEGSDSVSYVTLKPCSSSLEMTSFFGYNTTRELFTESTGEITQLSVNPEPIMTTSNNLNFDKNVKTVKCTPLFQSANTHDNYQRAKYENFGKLSLLLNNSIIINTKSTDELNILDLVNVKDSFSNDDKKTLDGLYLVVKKEMSFSNDDTVTFNYTAVREVSEDVK